MGPSGAHSLQCGIKGPWEPGGRFAFVCLGDGRWTDHQGEIWGSGFRAVKETVPGLWQKWDLDTLGQLWLFPPRNNRSVFSVPLIFMIRFVSFIVRWSFLGFQFLGLEFDQCIIL